MNKSVLIVGSEKSPYLSDVERRIFSFGFQTLFVVSSFEALEKLEKELFSIIIYDLKCADLDKVDFLSRVLQNPFAAVTPLIVLRDPRDAQEYPKLSSVLDQTFTVDTSSAFVADYVKETEDLRKKKVKKGSLATISVPRIIFDAYMFKFSGAAIFERLSEKKIIYFDQGSIVFASSNRPNERFGEFMISQGMISKEQLDQVLEISQKSSLRFGEILVEMGYIKRGTLEPLLRGQVKQILFSVFGWEIGDYYLLPEEESTVRGGPSRFKTSLLIFEGIKRRFDQSMLVRLLSPLNRPVRVDKRWNLIARDFGLTRVESTLIRRIKDGDTLDHIVGSSELTEFETLRILYLIYSTNLLKITDEAETIVGEVVRGKSPIAGAAVVDREKIRHAIIIPKACKVGVEPAGPTPQSVRRQKSELPRESTVIWKLFALGVFVFVVFAAVFYLYMNNTFIATELSAIFQKVKKSATSRKLKKEKPVPLTSKPVVSAPSPKAQLERKPSRVPSPVPTQVRVIPSPRPEVAKSYKRKTHAAGAREEKGLFFSYFRLGKKYFDEGKLTKSLSQYNKAYELNRRNDLLLVEMGRVYFELGRSVEAIEKYKQALRINPKNAEAHLYLGNAYQFHGKNELAIARYKTYLSLKPGSPFAREVEKVLKKLEKGGKR